MIAYDTDVLTELLYGKEEFVARAKAIPVAEQSVPIIVVEEIIRGRLEIIRRAEAGKAKVSLQAAYHLFHQTLNDLRHLIVLPYTAEAEACFNDWRQQKLRIGTHDLRIAAIAVSHSATLVSRNRRDFERVPGLKVEFWG
jgi:tRNA(fMet)-specific endonuclease VapC